MAVLSSKCELCILMNDDKSGKLKKEANIIVH